MSTPNPITETKLIGSQTGPPYEPEYDSFDGVINAFLQCGWQILETYTELHHADDQTECFVLLGWPDTNPPKYPPHYGPASLPPIM